MKESIDKDILIKELRLSNKSLNRRIGVLEKTACHVDKYSDYNRDLIQRIKVENLNLKSAIKEHGASEVGALNLEICQLKKDIESRKNEIQNITNQLIYCNAVRDQVLLDKQELSRQLSNKQDHSLCYKNLKELTKDMSDEIDSLRSKLSNRKTRFLNRVSKIIR